MSCVFTLTPGIWSFEIAFNSSPENLKQNSWVFSSISLALQRFFLSLVIPFLAEALQEKFLVDPLSM